MNLNRDDTQTLRDLTYFARELLCHVSVLPADLAGMLRAFASDLRNSPPSRWAGVGDPVQYECLAHRIAQSVTDGEWADGVRLDDPARNRHARAETPGNFQRALLLLAARGDIVTREGRFYTGSPDDRS